MANILAFPVHLHSPAAAGHGVGTGQGHVVAMDLFVLINLGLLLFMLGFFACWAWLIWRRTTRPEPHIQLIMELEDDPEFTGHLKAPAEENSRAAWERDQDWWRNQETPPPRT